MLSITQIKKGTLIVIDGAPFEIIDYAHSHVGRGGSVVQVKIRNLITGNVFDRNFKPSDKFKEAEIEKKKAIFIYAHKGEIVLQNPTNPKKRWSLEEKIVGDKLPYLKPKTEVELIEFENELVNINLPVKIDYLVKEAPPSEKGNTAQGGSKRITLETGLQINTPFFISTGDIVRVNTETGQYVERISKGV